MKSAYNKLRQWYKVGQRHIWFEYAGLSIIVLLPIFLPGYILTLDMVFTPHTAWPAELTSSYPLDAVLWLLAQVLPGDVVQKIVLIAILLLSGVGMHLLMRELLGSSGTTITPTYPRWSVSEQHQEADSVFRASPRFALRVATYFAGIFYMINPFVYSRLMAGQWQVLLGYALLPFFVLALVRLLAHPSWRTALWPAVWALVVLAASVHFVGMIIVLGVLFTAAGIIKYWKQRRIMRQLLMQLIAGGFTILVVSCYWLLSALFGQGEVGEIATRADATQFSAFATHSGPLGSVGEVLRLQGFWAEARELFVLPQDVLPFWGLIVLLLWILVVLGAVRLWRTNRPVAVIAIGSVVVGAIVAASPLMQQLAQIFPILGGYREPHKFTVLVALGFSLLAAFGVLYLVDSRSHKKAWAVACLALPLFITPTMFWAGAGQLRPVDYPQEWYGLNQQLKDNVPAGKEVLFLPWHMYAPYSFSNGRIIANPAEKFFEAPVIISDDPEFANIAPNRHDDTKHQIAGLLEHPADLPGKLQQLGISHVVVAKEQDWQTYDFLRQLPILYENDKLILYEVQP